MPANLQIKYFLFEIRKSDGNDCSVYDCIVEAESEDAANDQVDAHFDGLASKSNWESDGDGGYYFPCPHDVPDEPFDDPSECEQCEVLSINGVACHETGCPTFARYKQDLKAFERFDDHDCSPGGLTIQLQGEYETDDEAEEHCARYHSRYSI